MARLRRSLGTQEKGSRSWRSRVDTPAQRQDLVRDEAEKPYEPVYDSHGNEIVEDSDGQRYEVVKGMTNHASFTPGQERRIGEIYIRMAQELPTEGRDYIVRFEFVDPDGNPRVGFRPLTELGHAYVRHLAKVLQEPVQGPACRMKQHGGQ